MYLNSKDGWKLSRRNMVVFCCCCNFLFAIIFAATGMGMKELLSDIKVYFCFLHLSKFGFC